jgi:hypothetical protein
MNDKFRYIGPTDVGGIHRSLLYQPSDPTVLHLG